MIVVPLIARQAPAKALAPVVDFNERLFAFLAVVHSFHHCRDGAALPPASAGGIPFPPHGRRVTRLARAELISTAE